MQALKTTVFPCYVPSDRETAAAIATFLERGADVQVFLEEGKMWAGQDLAAKAREARMAEVVLILFSRDSMPSRWARAQWEDALVNEPATEGVRIGFVRCDDCVPPRVLLPRFELAGLPAKGLRELKRWIRHRTASYVLPDYARPAACETDLDVLGIAIADRPGAEMVGSGPLAFEFVRAFREDFDEVFALDCGDRSLAALAGDLGGQLGLRLEGDVEENLARLREFFSERRFLLLLGDVRGEEALEFVFGGRSSTLIVEGDALGLERNLLQRAQQAFTLTAGWTELCAVVRQGLRFARQQRRIAECYELMQQWHGAAEIRGDRKVLDESAREMVWILESWDRLEEAQRLDYRRASECDDQMIFSFE